MTNAMKNRFSNTLLLVLSLLLLCAAIPSAFAADEPPTITLNVTNTPIRGDVVLEKTGLLLKRFNDTADDYGNTIMSPVYEQGYLAGAVFELRASEDIVGKEGTVYYRKGDLVETLTTSGSGIVKSKLLPLGKYELQEVSAPDGYVFSSTPALITLTAADHDTAVVEIKVTASNTYLPVRVTLVKQKEELMLTETESGMVHQTVAVTPGAGFVFGLYNRSVIAYGDGQKLPANTLMATGQTNASGNLTFSGYYPHGDYYIKELAVPAGWKLSNQTWAVTLTAQQKSSAENVISVTLPDPILNELIYTPVTLRKADITGAQALPGALIEVSDAKGNVIYREHTNSDGTIPDIPVVPGTYTFRETYAPEGYALNTAVKTFTVTADGKVTGDTEIRDEINEVFLLKTRDNGEVLPGAVFGLFDADGQMVQDAVTDANGVVRFRKLGYGSYTIRELSAPHGFHPSTEEWSIAIDGTYENTDVPLATVVNTVAPGKIRLTKLDASDNHPIAGVQFDIYNQNGDLVGTMTTNQDGIAVSDELFPDDYVVVEHENPVGYVTDLWRKDVTVEMDEVTSVTATNMPMQGKIRIFKTDKETQKGLPGAVFTVMRLSGLPSHNGDNDGEIVAVIATDEFGYAETPLLTWGEYSVVETHVPEDYLDDGYAVTVNIPLDAEETSASESEK